MIWRRFALVSVLILGLAGCNNDSAVPVQQAQRSTLSELTINGETPAAQESVSNEEVRCYNQRLEQLSDVRIKSLINSDSSADTLTTDETVRLAQFYQNVAQECF